MGLDPVSKSQFFGKALFNGFSAASCQDPSCPFFGRTADGAAMGTTAPGMITPQVGGTLRQNVAIPITGMQATMIQNAINQSANFPPPYSITGPSPACDCGTWVQGVMSQAGLPSGAPAPIPSQLIRQLVAIYGSR